MPDNASRPLRSAREDSPSLLEEFVSSEWVLSKQEELRHTYLEALQDLGGMLFSEGRYAEAEEACRKAITQDRYSEAAHRQLMRALLLVWESGAGP